jgi:hypothetical protein
MMRRPFLALAVALAASSLIPANQAQAQVLAGTTGGVDPFSLYFGYYLPHQAYIAAQPTPLDTINQITAQRQFNALTERAGLYDPISPYGDEELDPLRPYSPKRGGERIAKPHVFASATSNAAGRGPALYYQRTARYFPHMRSGQGANRNLAATRSGRGMGGGIGGGMGGMGGMSMPGPR